ncbi:MAG: helix-turn-helix domain-containing protein [Bacteriovorax sp.]|nr:helix-turn-helix domain-containing protein [Bacteriovorax sp.]
MRQEKLESKNCSYAELSQELGVPIGTLYSMVSEKKIPHLRIGPRHVIFDRTEIKKWLDSHKVEAKGGV